MAEVQLLCNFPFVITANITYIPRNRKNTNKIETPNLPPCKSISFPMIVSAFPFFRRSHLISDDEYNYKLERLKNELNRAVVTLEEMHNRYKFTLPSKSSLTTTPATSMHNKSSIRQNKRFNTTSEHYDAMDILTKRKSTIEAMESELDASLADLDADDLNEG